LLDSSGNLAAMNEEQAKGVYHLFTAAAYFFPLIGSIIADVVLGKYRTILYLSLLYCLGHACLAVMDIAPHMLGMGMAPWMYAGLLFIAMGAGAIKPCVSAHVGDQFGPRNRHLVSKTFGWFYFSINTGAFASTMLTPIFLATVGPWLAFGVPGVLMAIATFVFWLGRNRFVHVPPAGGQKFVEETFSKDGVRALINLSPIFLIFIPAFWAIFDQTGSAWVLQAEGMDRKLGIEWLPSQIQAVNPLLILILIPVFTYIVYPAVGKVVKVTPLRKIGVGLFVTAGAFGLSALIESNINGGFVIESSSQSEVTGWARERLIDGDADGAGWSSRLRAADAEEEHEPEEVIVRLRERGVWTIDAVEVNPHAEKGKKPKHIEAVEWNATAPDLENYAKGVTVYARNARDTTQSDADGNPVWTEVGSAELAQENRLQAISFDPIEATHVKFEFDSNWGGDRIKVGQVR
ncbi:MAG: hypothetical protein KDA28_04130, partial [Phycisphaerales bacterium]|nr:hypothetical protein [Phycisphaerales bacterium]